MRQRLPLGLTAFVLSTLACDNGPAGNGDSEIIRLRLIVSRSVPEFPVALALSPNGEWLAVSARLGDAVALFDANTYEQVGLVTEFQNPWRLAISPGSDLLVVGRRQGTVIGLGLPSFVERFQTDFVGAVAIADPVEEGYYLNGRIQDVIRISPEGEVTARFEDDGADRIALSSEGDILFVDSGLSTHKIFALRTPSLEIMDEQPLPLGTFDGALVPLRSGRVMALAGPTLNVGPLLGVIYDPVAGEVGPPDTIVPTETQLTFGGGSPWAAISGGLVVVPVNTGTLVLDEVTGEVLDILSAEDFPDLSVASPCCDVVYDARRDRAIFTDVTTNAIHVFEIER